MENYCLFVRFCRHWVRNTCVVQLGWWFFNFKSYWEWNSISHRRKRWVQSSFPYVKAMFSLSQVLLFSILTSHEITSSVPSLSEWLNAPNWAILIQQLDSYFRVLWQFWRLLCWKVVVFAIARTKQCIWMRTNICYHWCSSKLKKKCNVWCCINYG